MNNEFKKHSNGTETRYVLESASAGATSAGAVSTSAGSVGGIRKRGDNLLAQEANKKAEAPKPRNFVAKNAMMGGAGAHADKKKAQKQGQEKHKNKSFDLAEGANSDLESILQRHANAVEHFKDGGDMDYDLESDLWDYYFSRGDIRNYNADASEYIASQLADYLGIAEGVDGEYNGEYDDEAGMAHGNLHTIARAAQGLLDTIEDKENLPEWAQEKIAKVEGMLVAVWDYLLSQEEQGIDPQQVSELKTSTLQRYSSKAHKSSIDHGIKAARAMDNDDTETWAKHADKRDSREHGAQRASAKIAAKFRTESPAELDEKAPPGMEAEVLRLKKQYPGEPEKAFATAWSIYNKKHGKKEESTDAYFESLTDMLERQLEPEMGLNVWEKNFLNANPYRYHQFQNKTPQKKR
jgi:hypothetical protein